ncbi:MAG: BrnT family toxin [Aestuariivirgaceae bacterium]|nr:BrnT family toxin [Aestuariivirgaceae bacterium]
MDFAQAGQIFAGPHFTKPDRRRDYGEDRFTSYGVLDERACVVVWTQRKENRRIISLRKADADESEFIRRVMGGP